MSSDRQRSNDESRSTGNGSSEAHQGDLAVPDRKNKTKQDKTKHKNTKLSRKTTAKLPTSCVKRLQKELTEVIHVSPPNCHAGPKEQRHLLTVLQILGFF
uniref:Uncharacterized protein n=1 Tax=Felis catus TaxID=9685 RepID=A0ABI7YTM8_FELCA